MARIIGRVIMVLVSLVLILAIVLGAFVFLTVRGSFPRTNGQVNLAGLNAPVDIYRDKSGIPHIYAETTHDLFFAQGYVHAQDRFWQMDFWRHVGSGRLSEMFGESQLGTDEFLRTLGWARVARQELDSMDAANKAILQAYADGVNAYLADHKGGALSLEYSLLKMNNPGYQMEPWEPLNSMTWAKAMAWDLRGNIDEEIARAVLLGRLSPQQLDDLYPPYPSDHPDIIPSTTSSLITKKGLATNADLSQFAISASQFATVSRHFASLDALLGPSGQGIGSNNWVISGKLTATGKPFLANDPHLSAQMPSIWYEIGLHCASKGPGCPYEVTGFSFAGTPSVIIGHNDRIAWGMTNTGPDVMDLYIEKVNPANPDQYEVNGKWVDMQKVTETIKVAGGQPSTLSVRYTRHGPVVSDSYESLKNFGLKNGLQKAGTDFPQPYAIALRWTALEPTYLFRAVLGFDAAQNWDEFRRAAQDFAVPAQNLVYADVDGNIGYQMPGNIPIRARGDGRLPVPGWTDDFEWKGYIPFDEHPSLYNPPQGYIITANNPVIGPQYPHLITTDWDYGYRAKRIVDLIQTAPGPIDIAYIQKMQGDDKSLLASSLVPVLMGVKLDDSHLESRRALLQNWDGQFTMDSAPAALFAAFWKHLLADTFEDDLPQDYWPDGDSRWWAVVERLAQQAGSSWWDNKNTPAVETRDDIFRQAFRQAVSELESSLGSDPTGWKWSELHTITFINPTLGSSGNPAIDGIFNRGPFPTAGGGSIINATGWDASQAGDTYSIHWLPSMRMIVDLGNLQNSLSIHTTGESGHAYHPHYIDMADSWRNIRYQPMLWERSQVEASAEGHLRLEP